MLYLTNTFSPQMLAEDSVATVKRINYVKAMDLLADGFTSAVSHQVTADILTNIIGKPVAFNRINIALQNGDQCVAIIPNFRAETAREFTSDEIGKNFSFFHILVA